MKRLVILLLALLLLAGCVQYDEELWINRNGSGHATIRVVHRSPYENPEEIMRKAALPGINLQSYDIHRKGPDVIYTIHFKFKSIDAFNNINDQLGAADFWGKITLNKEMEALYFSRMVIPFIKGKPQEEWHKHHPYFRHVGMYAYRTDVLEQITQLQPSSLENAESLEQLRWLENGFKVKCVVTDFDSHCIDTPEDIEKVIRLMNIK